MQLVIEKMKHVLKIVMVENSTVRHRDKPKISNWCHYK